MTTDQNYQQIYRVGGMLDAGFVGQITYTISLDQVYDELDIHFSFDKRLYSESDVTPELIDRLQTLCTAKYDAPTYPVEEFRQTILHEMKTEIHTMAELNDNFIGCIHRQLTDRHMLYTKEFTSDGCLAQDTFSGVLKVTVLVFNVLLDNTQYTLTVSGHPVGHGVIAPNFNLMDTVKTAAGNAGASNAAGSADTSCDAESAPASAVATAGSSDVSGAGSAAMAGDSSTTGSSSAGNTVTASTRFKRLELHNHTVESDGSLTCQELTEYLAADHVDAFAITDHNTTSGQKKIEQLLEEKHYPISLIRGMEYTTYFGHILCLNLSKYVPWNSIDQHRPELLFEAAREKGALVGIAHPFSYGDPFARGCRFEMTVSDYSKVDFIEIFNNPEPLHEVNERGTNLWMSLIFSGYQITATSGMDLHNRAKLAGCYATYIEGKNGGNIASELDTAIHTHRTWVSKGALLLTEVLPETNELLLTFTDAHKTGFAVPKTAQVVLKGKDKTFTTSVSLGKPVRVSLNQLSGTDPIIPLLYEAPGTNSAAVVSNATHVAASTSCGNAADTSSAAATAALNAAAGQLEEIDTLPAIEGLLCVSPVLYRD
ncbi:PHP domain-containing protein [Firmicutes bacterium AF36-19BH]|nr:PHP domain-containing protein [Firmicutes bacterium AF36-19BH]